MDRWLVSKRQNKNRVKVVTIHLNTRMDALHADTDAEKLADANIPEMVPLQTQNICLPPPTPTLTTPCLQNCASASIPRL